MTPTAMTEITCEVAVTHTAVAHAAHVPHSAAHMTAHVAG
jgi:hypothetical protein